ncbi:glycosyltransferase [Paenibacillus phocaensis]|uniref:glycosyltransferase n=1 Tax=Paenibacillus phocaensis TaxID=1776378 RepID=UPI000839BCEA|nr:glycosyltransferase [Paenibacillus phocaensis]
MSKKVVIESNFNTFGFDPQRFTRPWLEKRIAIFRNFTLNSLKAQTNQNFLAVFKIAEGTEAIVADILSKQPPLPSNIWFGTNRDSIERIKAFAGKSVDLYVARLDSDDLYHKTYVQQLYDYVPKPGTVALINQNGYLWDSVHGEMAPTFHRSPQFYVYLYKTAEYLSGYRVKLPGRGTHGNVIDLPHELLAPRNYVNVIHQDNTSAKKVPPRDRLSPGDIRKVLKEFMG